MAIFIKKQTSKTKRETRMIYVSSRSLKWVSVSYPSLSYSEVMLRKCSKMAILESKTKTEKRRNVNDYFAEK